MSETGQRPVILKTGGHDLWLWCPACKSLIRITDDQWSWDDDATAPTISPSILSRGVDFETGAPNVCHSFVKAGQWEFLADSTHALAGTTVPMEPLPAWFTDARATVVDQEGYQ
jgi:hypothetical protein